MSSWINIHDPTPRGNPPTDYNKLYLQEKNQGRRGEIHTGDIGFIYETGGSSRVVKVSAHNGTCDIRLEKGRKGLIAAVRVSGDFVDTRWIWDGKRFIGWFPTKPIDTREQFVSLADIKSRLRSFNPRINGGLRKLERKLELDEESTLRRLMGFSSSA